MSFTYCASSVYVKHPSESTPANCGDVHKALWVSSAIIAVNAS